MVKVVGVSEKNGVYEGRDYHNVYLHTLSEDENCFGHIAEQIKIKFANVASVFGKAMSAADWQSLVGKTICPYYNRFGNVEKIDVFSDEKSK